MMATLISDPERPVLILSTGLVVGACPASSRGSCQDRFTRTGSVNQLPHELVVQAEARLK